MNPGDPGLETWPSLDAARHGGAQPWLPGAYDPETKLYIFGTGNPTPAYTAGPRRRRQPVHVLARRGERRHRQDGVVLPDVAARHARLGFGADADPDRRRSINGKMRKLVSTAARNGYFFTLDRVTGEHIVTSKYGLGDELGRRASTRTGAPARSRQGCRPSPARSCRRPPAARSTGSRPRTRPTPGCSTCPSSNGYSIFYLTDPDPRGSMGLGGKERSRRRHRPAAS